MMSGRWMIPAVLVGIVLAFGAAAGSALGETRSRALERVVSKGMFDANDSARLQRAFSAALKAGVAERDALTLVEACVEGEFETAHALRLLSIVSQLALEHLPIDGFIAKIEEGVSKRVSPDLVVQAAERRALMLTKARLILNSLVLQGVGIEDPDDLLPDLAAALEAGRTPEDARAILTEAFESGERPGGIRRKLFP